MGGDKEKEGEIEEEVGIVAVCRLSLSLSRTSPRAILTKQNAGGARTRAENARGARSKAVGKK